MQDCKDINLYCYLQCLYELGVRKPSVVMKVVPDSIKLEKPCPNSTIPVTRVGNMMGISW